MPFFFVDSMLKLLKWTYFLLLVFSIFACTDLHDNERKAPSKGTWVSPSVDSRGRVRKGHYRRPASTNKNAVKNQARSRYYYETRGKYKRKSKKD
jgi:hypothetical protein